MVRYKTICNILIAKRLRRSGYSIKQISVAMEVSVSTVRRWLK